jgi:A/G-specific adenine glycosylase
LPRPAARPEITQVTEASVAICRAGKVLLRRRPPNERWSGLWDFPRFPLENGSDWPRFDASVRLPIELRRQIETQVRDLTGARVSAEAVLTELRHSVTRFRIRLVCLRAGFRGGLRGDANNLRWFCPAEFESLPLSVTGRKFARLLVELGIDE